MNHREVTARERLRRTKAPDLRCMYCGELGGQILTVKGNRGYVWQLAEHPMCARSAKIARVYS